MAVAAPIPGAHFFALDDGGVLFCEPAQRFYDLNATASLCWLGVADGLSEDAILDELAKQSGSALVQRIGNVGVFYRRHKDKPKIILPAD